MRKCPLAASTCIVMVAFRFIPKKIIVIPVKKIMGFFHPYLKLKSFAQIAICLKTVSLSLLIR